VPNRNSAPRPLSREAEPTNVSKSKLDMDSFVVVNSPVAPSGDKPPSLTKEQVHSEPGTYNYLKLHLVECKDLKVDSMLSLLQC
jgi:hypothetical protein